MDANGRGEDNRWLGAAVHRGAAYDRRFEELAAAGRDVHGEATFVEALGVGSVLDAGCGTGRVAIELARKGLEVVGVDLDPAMLAEARAKAPSLAWVEGDLAQIDLGRRFEAVVLAGNVMLFVAPGSEGDVIVNLARHLVPGGALVAGFSLNGQLSLREYDALATASGLDPSERFATWSRDRFEEDADYAVSVHRHRC